MIFRSCQTSDDYAWLSCFAKIFCASHKNVSSVFRFPDCTLESNFRLRKIGSIIGLVSAGSNGFDP